MALLRQSCSPYLPELFCFFVGAFCPRVGAAVVGYQRCALRGRWSLMFALLIVAEPGKWPNVSSPGLRQSLGSGPMWAALTCCCMHAAWSAWYNMLSPEMQRKCMCECRLRQSLGSEPTQAALNC
eukprot:scaffold316665_cov17-Tisochrysis_lutea.AAC.1